MSNKKKKTHSRSLFLRIFTIALAVLVTGGAVTYLVLLIQNLIH